MDWNCLNCSTTIQQGDEFIELKHRTRTYAGRKCEHTFNDLFICANCISDSKDLSGILTK